jgi:ribonuclease Z
MRVTFLGTSGSMPTPERGASAVAVKLGRDLILFDCGEGTQRQMVIAGLSFHKVTLILITHLHGDHVLGLPGILQTMSLLYRKTPLVVVGPRGLYDYLQVVSSRIGGPTFPVTVKEIASPEVVYVSNSYNITAVSAKHSIEAWSYALNENPHPGRFHPEKAIALGIPKGQLWKRLQDGEELIINGKNIAPREVLDLSRPGRKFVYSGDTVPTDQLRGLATDADILVHEATFLDELSERAAVDGHSTARQAAMLAAEAGVKRLFLTHISSRYNDPTTILAEARTVFPSAEVAYDFLKIEISLK